MQRIVTRADLAGSESPHSASPEPDVLVKSKGLNDFDFVAPNAPGNAIIDGLEPEESEDIEFQLFAAPRATDSAQAKGAVHKIRLRSPSLDPDRIGFIRPYRNQNHYFADPPSVEQKNRLELAALTGDEVTARSTSARPGSAYPWKVLHLPLYGLSKELQPEATAHFNELVDDERTKKRTRPGKKYRIKLRKKLAASQAQKDARKAAEEAKEAAEREKRTRRNREKKVKKKAREKAKKGGENPAGETEDVDSATPGD